GFNRSIRQCRRRAAQGRAVGRRRSTHRRRPLGNGIDDRDDRPRTGTTPTRRPGRSSGSRCSQQGDQTVSLANFTSTMVLNAIQSAVSKLVISSSDVDENLGERIVPLDLRRWLARLRLLEGVPFAYLAADSMLLPPESIRFF